MDQVEQALAAMYSPSASQEQKKEAASFLENFQKTPEAWQAAHQILANNQLPLEYRMFAAQTLRSKATYDLLQVPDDALPQLKDSVLDLLTEYASKDKLIRTQLSLALCQLALQYLAWHDAMVQITARLLSLPKLLPALLEFLKILPEDLTDSNKTPLTDEQFNDRTKVLISDNVPHVLLLLQNLAQQGSETTLVLECLNSWIKECPIEDVLRIDALASLVFQALTQEHTFEKASDCLCSALRETRDIDNYELIDALYQQILQVHDFYSRNQDRLEDPEVVSGLTRIYVEAGESWHMLIAKNATHFKPLVEILLQCCKYDEDLDVVKYTFYFWYQLKQMLTLPRFEQSRAELSPIYLELILVIIKHLAYPIAANDNDLFDGDKEQEDKFKDFRYEMGDVLKDCCAVVGAQKALNVPFQQIVQLVNLPNVQWQLLEAPLFSMRVMAKEVSLKEKTILPVIMQMLVQLPEHPKIRYATTLVLGRYSEWTSKHPEFLEPQINYIIKGFENTSSNDKDIVSATAQALMYFCQDCASLLVNHLDQLYMLYQQLKTHLDVKATYDLVDGLAHVIKCMPLSDQYKASLTFLGPTLERITELAHGNLEDDAVTTALHDEAEILSIFLSILRCVDYSTPEYPIANYFMDFIWPVISQVISKFGKTLKVSEHFTKVIKNAIQSCTGYLLPKLGEISSLLHEGFQSTYYGCYLWVTGVLIQSSEEFVEEADRMAILQLAIQQSASFLLLLRNNSAIDIRGIPDVIEDYFNMAGHLLMFYPLEVISNNELCQSILEAGVVALTTSEEYNPLMACVHYFIDYISWGSPYPPVSFFEGDHEQIRQKVKLFLASGNHGQQLLTVVLHGLIHKFYNDVDANDLLIKILTVSPDAEAAVGWLHTAVSELRNVNDQEINKLIGAVSVALPNKDNRRVRVAVKDFVSWYTRKNVNSRATFS